MKKSICFAIIAFLYSTVVFSQHPNHEFTLVGTFVGTPVNKVSITYIDSQGKKQNKTDTVKNNSFNFTGNINGITSAKLIFEPAKEIEASNLFDGFVLLKFYLEPAKMTLSGDVANVVDMKVTGTNTQREYNEFLPAFWSLRKRLNTMMAAYYAEKDIQKQELISGQMSPHQKQIGNMVYKFAIEHRKSFVSADLAKTYKFDISFDSLKYIYQNLLPEVRATSAGKALKDEVKRIEAGSPGSYAVNFSRNDIKGKPISLTEFKGRYVLLDFWASWCLPCRAGNPHLLELYKRYRRRGFEIIGISDNDHNPASWKAAVTKDEIGVWRHILRGYDTDISKRSVKNANDLSEQYGVDILPTKILIDPHGKIIGRYTGTSGMNDSTLDKKLSAIYN